MIDALRAADAASFGSPGTLTVNGGPSRSTSMSRTEPEASASTNAACGKVVARSSGLTYGRSATSTTAGRWFGSRNVRAPAGEANTARLRACSSQNSSSSTSSSSSSRIASIPRRSAPASSSCRIAAPLRFLSSILLARASWVSGLVGT